MEWPLGCEELNVNHVTCDLMFCLLECLSCSYAFRGLLALTKQRQVLTKQQLICFGKIGCHSRVDMKLHVLLKALNLIVLNILFIL